MIQTSKLVPFVANSAPDGLLFLQARFRDGEEGGAPDKEDAEQDTGMRGTAEMQRQDSYRAAWKRHTRKDRPASLPLP